MSMEKYRECLVPRERSGSDRAAELVLMLAAIVCCLIALFINQLAFIGAAIFVLLWYLRMNHYRVEHEYILTEDTLAVDIIYNQKRRKKLGTYELKKVLAIADSTDQRLESLRGSRKPKWVDYSSHGEKSRDLSIFMMDDKQNLLEIVLTPDETMKKMIMKQVPALARRLEMI